MKASQYKKVLAEVKSYIEQGKPIAAGHVMEQWENQLSHKQYYELTDLIYRACNA